MNRNLFTFVPLFLCLFIGVAFVSCGDIAPELSRKEQDSRLIGAWTHVENHTDDILPKDKYIEFRADGSCVGFSYPGHKRLFYTGENHYLYIYVYGGGLKFASRTHTKCYRIERDTLYLWRSLDEMLSRQYKRARAYIRASKP